MGQELLLFPECIRSKAVVSFGEARWHQHDVEELVESARQIGLGNIGGEVQFLFAEGICEVYWLNFGPGGERLPNESWTEYVNRTSDELLSDFRNLCNETDFRELASKFDFIQEQVRKNHIDPVDHLVFEISFVTEERLCDLDRIADQLRRDKRLCE